VPKSAPETLYPDDPVDRVIPTPVRLVR
jgi:hypothetical protein